ncbi:MAG: TRAP transporter small permease [Betaproteobacteria bacterium]|nr:TRAP transporter small permease [Betaproteobacteria bacterium]MDH4322527.1 TRAP transporter small permease [Betaproteobacteria bacterium]MDH5212112.1 TRAP transporter small permease [Betaproteobacteria bacterium]MDH5576983.1 TRAP transporter small permease [Betaproteobacteria bacterium]
MAGLNAIGSVWVAAITVLICADILGRVLFKFPLVGVPEIVKVSIVAIVWLQIPHTLKTGGHLRSDVVLRFLSGRTRAALDVFAYGLGAVIFGLLVYSGWDTMIQAWQMGEFEGELPVRVPTYPLRSIVLLGAALAALQYLLMTAEAVRRLVSRSSEAP